MIRTIVPRTAGRKIPRQGRRISGACGVLSPAQIFLQRQPQGGGYVPVFSQRAVDVLGEFLTQDGELLPLSCDQGTYFAFDVTRVLDALDAERSGVKRFSGSGRIIRIVTREFIPERLQSVHIFKLQQAPHWDNYVTQSFVERVRAAGLTGFVFTKVWSVSGRDSVVS